MKTKYLSGVFFILVFFLWSCDLWIDPNLNVDPTAPKDASMNVILPTTQTGIAYVLGGDIDRFTSLFTQHHLGVARQHQGLYRYSITESDPDNAWNTMWFGPMMDLYQMINKSKANSSPHYEGVAEVLMAYSVGMWTDIMGDIPYSECFQGNGNLRPKYETQEAIYNHIFALLDDAIVKLGAAESVFSPADDDFMYQGNLGNWIKAAYTLKARFYLHIKRYDDALTALALGFASNAEDMQVSFGTTEAEANPLYQFMDQRGDISMGGMLIDMMNALNDPRLPAFAMPDSGRYSTLSLPGPFYGSINSPVPFITYAEAKFILAEVLFYKGDMPGAYSAYIDAITASLEKFGVSNDDIITYTTKPEVDPGQVNLTLKLIMEQKYIAMYFQYESWSDWRRTGFPVLVPTTQVLNGQIPRRFPYPQSERLFNGTNMRLATDYSEGTTFMITKVWWDKMWP